MTCEHLLLCRTTSGGSARSWDSILAVPRGSSNLLSLHYRSHLLFHARLPWGDTGQHLHEWVWQPSVLLRLLLSQDSWKISRWERTEGVPEETDRAWGSRGHYVIVYFTSTDVISVCVYSLWPVMSWYIQFWTPPPPPPPHQSSTRRLIPPL